MIENQSESQDAEIRYEGDKRLVKILIEKTELTLGQRPVSPWKDQGVYLITGGMGGLGCLFAEAIAKGCKQPILILTGRSVLNEEMEKTLSLLKEDGAEVVYQPCDISNLESVHALTDFIQSTYGRLTGVIHSAGLIRDNFIFKKSLDEFSSVLLAKVSGFYYLDQVMTPLHPDWIVSFSSIAGVIGNLGQADYAVANAFMDNYVTYHDQINNKPFLESNFPIQDSAKRYSINWPLWKEGGMQIDAASEERMKQLFGMDLLSTEMGRFAFDELLETKTRSQVLVVSGLLSKIRVKLLNDKRDQSRKNVLAETENQNKTEVEFEEGINLDELKEKVQIKLIHEVSNLLKIDSSALGIETELSEYGFDSISLTTFSNKLNADYQLELTPTIFFEYPTIKGFAHFLAETYTAEMGAHFSIQKMKRQPVPEFTNADH